jgi:hypothetical protein
MESLSIKRGSNVFMTESIAAFLTVETKRVFAESSGQSLVNAVTVHMEF